MKSLFFAMLCIGVTYAVGAQECQNILTGKVIDFHDKTPLMGATIIVLDENIATMSDANGRYTIAGLCEGSYELEVSHPECSTLFIPLQIDGDTTYDIKLEHHLEELQEVKVIGDALYDQTNSAQEASLALSTLEQYSGGSLGEALKEVGGVSSLNTGANIVKPIIHGLNGSRVLVLNDGVRMQDMEWGAEHAPNIDINAAGSITVVKGASALQYGGDAIGGTIIMEPRRIFMKDTLFGKTLVNGISNGRGGAVTSELSRIYENGWYVKGQGSYKRLGDQEAPDYMLSNTGIQEIGASLEAGKNLFEWGFNTRYSYYDAEIAILRASHIGNVDDLIRSINSGQPEIIGPFTYDLQNPRQKVTHHLGKFELYKRFEGMGKWTFQYDFQNNRRFEFDVRVGDDRDKPSIDLELTTHTLNTDFKWDANRDFQLHAGLMGRYQDNFANPDTGVRRLIPDYEKFDFGGFLISEYRLNGYWKLDAGIRYDFSRIDAKKFYQTSRWEERGYDVDFPQFIIDDLGTQLLTNPVFDYSNVSATAGIQFSKDNNRTFRFNYALAQRAPNPSEIFSDGLHHSAARIELGDLRIGSETSHKFSLSYERQLKNWGYTLEPHANFLTDFILLEPSGVELTIRGAFPVWSYRQTNARISGVDASAYVDWAERWQTDHRFSLVKGNDTEGDQALINIPSASLRNRLTYSRPEWKNFELSLRSDYVFRQNEFPPNITVFSPEQQEDVILEINTPPDAYHLLGLFTKMEFPLGQKTKMTTSLTVNNLLDTNYRDYLNRQRFFADDLGRNIIVQVKFNY
tara:strand:- start:4092 stop:6491 length:2400 start_codon:yes stop_codon:yes gene_type:complete